MPPTEQSENIPSWYDQQMVNEDSWLSRANGIEDGMDGVELDVEYRLVYFTLDSF